MLILLYDWSSDNCSDESSEFYTMEVIVNNSTHTVLELSRLSATGQDEEQVSISPYAHSEEDQKALDKLKRFISTIKEKGVEEKNTAVSTHKSRIFLKINVDIEL